MSERIDHYEEALDHLDKAEDSLDVWSAAVHLKVSQVHATLALVEQQRIANVIDLADRFEQPQALDAILDRTPPSGSKGWIHRGLQPGIRETLRVPE